VFLFLNKILPDTRVIGILTRTSLLTLSVMVILGDRTPLGRSVGICASLYYLSNLVVFLLNNSLHPWLIVLLFVADLLFGIVLIKRRSASNKNSFDRIADIAICLGLLGVIISSFLALHDLRFFSAIVAILFLLYNTYRTRGISNFAILMQLAVIIVAFFF